MSRAIPLNFLNEFHMASISCLESYLKVKGLNSEGLSNTKVSFDKCIFFLNNAVSTIWTLKKKFKKT